MKHLREERLWGLARQDSCAEEQFLMRRHLMDCDTCASAFAELKPMQKAVDQYKDAVANVAEISEERHDALWLNLEAALDAEQVDQAAEYSGAWLPRWLRPALGFSAWLLPGLALAAVMAVAVTQINPTQDERRPDTMPSPSDETAGVHGLALHEWASENAKHPSLWTFNPALRFWPTGASSALNTPVVEIRTNESAVLPEARPDEKTPASKPRIERETPPTSANPSPLTPATQAVAEAEESLPEEVERLYREGRYRDLASKADEVRQGTNAGWTPRTEYLYALSLRALGEQERSLAVLEGLALGNDTLLADRARYEKAILLADIPGRREQAHEALAAYLAAPGAKPFAEEVRYRLCLEERNGEMTLEQELGACMDYLAHHATGYRATPVAQRVAGMLLEHKQECRDALPLVERLPYGTLRQTMQEEMDYLRLRCYIHLEKDDMARRAAETYLRRHPNGTRRPVAQEWLNTISDTQDAP